MMNENLHLHSKTRSGNAGESRRREKALVNCGQTNDLITMGLLKQATLTTLVAAGLQRFSSCLQQESYLKQVGLVFLMSYNRALRVRLKPSLRCGNLSRALAFAETQTLIEIYIW